MVDTGEPFAYRLIPIIAISGILSTFSLVLRFILKVDIDSGEKDLFSGVCALV